jgi:hypothetical protein
MRRSESWARGAIILVIAIPVALLAFAAGHIVHGWNNPDTQCSYASQEPPISIKVHGESGMGEDGGWSVFPLGIACTFEEPGDGIPPQTVIVANWPATVIFSAAAGATIFGLVLMAGPERWFRERQGA